jgi:hypothetical protein
MNSANFSRQATGLLSHFLEDKSGGAVRGRNEVQDEAVKAAVEYIWNFSHAIVDVPAVARKVGLARRTLDRRFAAATGHSVLEEIQFCRVTRAAAMNICGWRFRKRLGNRRSRIGGGARISTARRGLAIGSRGRRLRLRLPQTMCEIRQQLFFARNDIAQFIDTGLDARVIDLFDEFLVADDQQ